MTILPRLRKRAMSGLRASAGVGIRAARIPITIARMVDPGQAPCVWWGISTTDDGKTMNPENHEIFEAMILLAASLSPTEVLRGCHAAGWSFPRQHPAISDAPVGTNDLRAAFDKENSLDEQKARRSLCLLAEQWIADVGKDRVQTTFGESGLEFVENEFRRLERQAPIRTAAVQGVGRSVLPRITQKGNAELDLVGGVGRSVLPRITQKGSAELDPDNAQHELRSSPATVSGSGVVSDIRANRFAGSDAVPVEQVQPEHTTSLASLEQLLDTLDGLHGSDASGDPTERNTQEIPLTEAELSDLQSVVKSAVELHQVRSFSE